MPMNTALVHIVPLLAQGLIPPLAILVLCVAAGIGTILLLPGRRETSFRKIGGVVLLAVMLILAALVARQGAIHTSGDVYFWIFSAIAVIGAVRVITHPKPVYSALYFVLTVFASAGLFILLWAEFMAAALILIYAGAILVTYVFVIMLASQARSGGTGSREEGEAEYDRTSREPVLASAVGFGLMGVMLFLIFDKGQLAADTVQPMKMAQLEISPAPPLQTTESSSIRDLGEYLFQNQLVSLELAGLLLTISMVGAILIARRQVISEKPVIPEEITTKGTVIEPTDDPHAIPIYGTTNPQAKAYPET